MSSIGGFGNILLPLAHREIRDIEYSSPRLWVAMIATDLLTLSGGAAHCDANLAREFAYSFVGQLP